MSFLFFLGIHAIVKNGNRLTYVIYNLSSGKAEQECVFPTDSTAFMGTDPSGISLTITGEVNLLQLFCKIVF